MNSVAGLSIHKAGSSVLNTLLTILSKKVGLSIDDIASNSTSSSISEGDYCISRSVSFVSEGYYYGMFRGPYVSSLHNLDILRNVVQVRHPLDCLVSAYFSFKVSHKAPTNPEKLKEFEARRAHLSQISIGDYCRSGLKGYIDRFKILESLHAKLPHFLLLNYEDMILSNNSWSQSILNFLEISITSEELNKLLLKRGISFAPPQVEDVTSHHRKALPGDHLEKLNPSLVNELMNEFKDELKGSIVASRYL